MVAVALRLLIARWERREKEREHLDGMVEASPVNIAPISGGLQPQPHGEVVGGQQDLLRRILAEGARDAIHPTSSSATATTTTSLSPATFARRAAATGPKVALSATFPSAAAAGKTKISAWRTQPLHLRVDLDRIWSESGVDLERICSGSGTDLDEAGGGSGRSRSGADL
ncbi:uncharacterized protein HKW66_Vig0228230 [Vigna angularis]|uniref:Uncharacterized protein n=1 Tax=Phaseolus angularis TaxID=3914 RepID=A0A8T0KAV0_PHAAN|nr:uncharacterized protein HKW66_Vig0228230 [Vigna angularis]